MEETEGKKEITFEIKHPEVLVLLAFLIFVFYLEAQVTLNSPIAFGDEGYHTLMAQWIGTEKEYPIWEPTYGSLIDKSSFNQKPMWNLLEGSFYMLFGFNDVIVKILTPFIASILLGLSVFILVKKIYNGKIGLISSIIVITLPTITTYGVLVYTDSLFTFYFSLFVLTFILAFKTEKMKYWILSGVFASLAILIKNPGYAIFPFIGVAFLYMIYDKKNLFGPLRKFSIVLLTIMIILGGFFFRSYVYFKTPDCYLDFLTDVSGCNIESGYTPQYKFEGRTEEVGTEQTIWRIGITSYLDFAYGNVWFVSLAFLCGLILMFLRKSKVDVLLLLTFFAMLPIFYMGARGRVEDLARYTLGWAPVIALVGARYFGEAYEFIKKYQKYLAFAVFVFVIYFGFQNAQAKLDVMKQVKQFSPAFFEACNWIKSNLEKDVRIGGTIWASAAIYNCQRNFGGGGPDVVVSNNLTLALSVLKMQGVTHLFLQKFSISWQDQKLRERYPASFIQMLENNPDHFEKIYENGPSIEECRNSGGCDGSLVYKIKY